MRFATLSSSTLVSLLLGSTLAAQQSFPMVIERRGPVPSSLEEAVQEAGLVAVIQVVGGQDRPRGRVPGTDFRARVLEVIKKDAALSVGAEITIHRDGGWIDRNGTREYVEERGFPLWRPGTTLVAFLGSMEDPKVFHLASGPESTIERGPDGKAKTIGRGQAAREQHGKPFDDVLARIRSVVR